MSPINLAEVTAAINKPPRSTVEVEVLDVESSEPAQMPSQWRPILRSPDSTERRKAALALWNQDFVTIIPQFMTLLNRNLLDVRAALLYGECTLLYVNQLRGEPYSVWVGRNPHTFGTFPPLWDSILEPLQTFLHEVHPGFGGLLPPAAMSTMAEYLDDSGPLECLDGEEECADIDMTNLLIIAETCGFYLASPDLPSRTIAFEREGWFTVEDPGPALDDMLANYLFDPRAGPRCARTAGAG